MYASTDRILIPKCLIYFNFGVHYYHSCYHVKYSEFIPFFHYCNIMFQCAMPVEQGHTCYISTCPRHKRRLKLGDTGTLYINMTTGYFVCKACRKSGSWNTLQDNIAFILEGIQKKRRYSIICI